METNGRREIRWYEVLYVVILVALLVVSVFYLRPHRVGVLDLDRVVRGVKLGERVAADVRQTQADAVAKGTQLQEAHNRRMNELSRKLKTAAGDADKDEIQSEMATAQEAYQQSVRSIRDDLQQHQSQVMLTFQKRLQPFVAKIARQRRLDVVLLAPSAELFYFDSDKRTVDITDAVVEDARAAFSADKPLIDPTIASKADRDNGARKRAAIPAGK